MRPMVPLGSNDPAGRISAAGSWLVHLGRAGSVDHRVELDDPSSRRSALTAASAPATPGWRGAIVERSGISRIAADTTRAAIVVPTPMKKTSAIAMLNDWWMPKTMSPMNGCTLARSGCGMAARRVVPRSLPTSTRLVAWPPPRLARACGGTPAATSLGASGASCVGSSDVRRLPNTVPSSARPTEPPIWRKKVRLLVATPS